MDHPNYLQEIVSLNDDDLGIEELERRLELAVAWIPGMATTNFDCGTFVCNGMSDCPSLSSCNEFTVNPREIMIMAQ